MSSKTFRPDIQGLRGVAVALVILTHANVVGFSGGYVGVDVFFVISGFVITQLLMRQPARQLWRNLAHFYTRRVLRIAPAATLVLVSTVFVAYALLADDFDPRLTTDVRWAALFAANFRLINLNADYFVAGLSPSLVTHYWSLAVEEQFYFVYPLLVFGLTYLAAGTRRTTVLRVFLGIAIAVSAIWSAYYTSVAPIPAYYSPLTRFWELALGGLVATTGWRLANQKVNSAIGVVAAVALGGSVYFLQPGSVFPGLLAWWPCVATAVILWVGQASSPLSVNRILAVPPLRYLGDISYSLYLWHFGWLVLPAQLEHPPTAAWWTVIAVAGALVCAMVSYHFVENPFRHSQRLQRDGIAVAILLAVFIALSWNATLLVDWWSLNR